MEEVLIVAAIVCGVVLLYAIHVWSIPKIVIPCRPPVNACIWLAADGWRFKVGYEITGTLDTDWKVMSTESYDTEREARADLVKIICTGWTIDEVEG